MVGRAAKQDHASDSWRHFSFGCCGCIVQIEYRLAAGTSGRTCVRPHALDWIEPRARLDAANTSGSRCNGPGMERIQRWNCRLHAYARRFLLGRYSPDNTYIRDRHRAQRVGQTLEPSRADLGPVSLDDIWRGKAVCRRFSTRPLVDSIPVISGVWRNFDCPSPAAAPNGA